jgi:lipoyl-dependent peroxiredoxin
LSTIYTTSVTSSGNGRSGHVRSDDGALDLDLALPQAASSSGDTVTNPEQLFAAGYAACFHSAVRLIADQRKIRLTDTTITAVVSLGPNTQGGFELTVTLRAALPGVDKDVAQQLVQAAHQVCPYSNATRGNIDVSLEVL